MDLLIYLYLVLLIIISFLLGKILGPFVVWLLGKLVIKTKSTLDDRVLDAIRSPLESFFFLFLIYLGVHFFAMFESYVTFTERYTIAALTLLITYLAYKVVKALFDWYYEEGIKESQIKVDLSLLPLLQKITRVLVVLFGSALFLAELGVDVTAILAVTSVITLILGLASQETLANFFAGIAMQLDRQINYGDYVRLPSGDVARLRKIGLRSTKLIDAYDTTIIMSNSDFAKTRFQLLSKGKSSGLAFFYFDVHSMVDPNYLENILKEELKKEKLDSDVDISSLEIILTKTKAPGWYECIIKLKLKDYSRYAKVLNFITKIINREISKILQPQQSQQKK
ncbi:MAG: mechanosensitive ion channel family protein [Candidatus Diapherotrites archaeon]|nr:mechanosensitive ion channel family protein [Candidatus Diapherotrites archaeon]